MIFNQIFLVILSSVYICTSSKLMQPLYKNDWNSAITHHTHQFRHINDENILKLPNRNPSFRSINKQQQFVIDSMTGEHSELIYRLPNNTIPESYDISIWTLIENSDFQFNGNVTIRIKVLTTTTFITLHQSELTINSVTLTNLASNENIFVNLTDQLDYTKINEFLTITFDNKYMLIGGNYYNLTIAYNGTLRSDDAGFYRSSYFVNDNDNDTDTSEKWLATTQFESTDARHGFPCYDEPQLKANFSIKITHRNDCTALSNMPVAGIERK